MRSASDYVLMARIAKYVKSDVRSKIMSRNAPSREHRPKYLATLPSRISSTRLSITSKATISGLERYKASTSQQIGRRDSVIKFGGSAIVRNISIILIANICLEVAWISK